MIRFPISVEPVKAILSTMGFVTSSSPTAASPVMILITPLGKSVSARSFANSSALSDVSGAGLRTIVHPAARAGPIFHIAICSGKFHGIIPAATPDRFPDNNIFAYTFF